jgi:peptidoglycan/xylan/chitin deacetylase (PgdA/CDA1 family)
MTHSAAINASKPCFLVSLDFELFWGLKDHVRLEDYSENLLGVRKAIPGMLSLFRQYGVHATWATVGMLFYENRDQLFDALPSLKPAYVQSHLSNYSHLSDVGENEDSDPFHFGASLIRKILDTPSQELATHTFSHYYCLEAGQTVETFRADLVAAVQAAKRFGVTLKSIVFPRNQSNPLYLRACSDAGLVAYRGNAPHFLYRPNSSAKEKRSYIKRGLRLADNYAPIADIGPQSPSHNSEGMLDIPASRFLRPYSRRLRRFEHLRLHRIQNELEVAARSRSLYHLWWHPHNFGINTTENLSFLERILEKVAALRDTYGMTCPSMAELAAETISHSAAGAK